jgi:hypothetical protein
VRIFDIHEQTPDIGVGINVLGVDLIRITEEKKEVENASIPKLM